MSSRARHDSSRWPRRGVASGHHTVHVSSRRVARGAFTFGIRGNRPLISKPSSFAFDVAISSVANDARLLRELERQLGLRLPSMPPLRPVWTSAATELLDAPRSSVFGKTARVAVVLHQHLWGKDDTTKADAAAIKRRVTANGPDSVR